MCDNSVNPPVLKDASKDLTKILSLVNDRDKIQSERSVAVIAGKENAVTKSYKLENNTHFGSGKDKEDNYWKSIIRQAVVQDFY